MDAMDILGGLLGGGSKSGGGLGGKILKDLMGGGRRSSPPPSRGSTQGRSRRTNIESEAKQLEDLLGVAKDRYTRRSAPQTRSQPAPPPAEPPRSGRGGFSFDDRAPVGRREQPEPNEEAVILIRAMINSAKADGRVTPDEQQEIMNRISNPSREAMEFLKQEFSRPVDVREFAWSVPIGMEQKVYTLSIAAIDFDSTREAKYLKELAHGLRMEPELCNEIHQQYGLPALY